MAKKVPKSLSDAILEEPQRFASYLDINLIANSKNPYQEFLRQFEIKFGSQQGLNLWQYLQGRYNLLNKIYKSNFIQSNLSNQFKTPLRKEIVNTYFKKRTEKIRQKQQKRLNEIKKSPQRLVNSYTPMQNRFIKNRSHLPTRELTEEFNKFFNRNVSFYGIRDKKLRILGKKK